VRSPVAKKPVDDHANDGEEEDDEAPEDLASNVTVGLQYFDENDDVENENDEPEDTTTGAVTPGVAVTCNVDGLLGHDEVGEEGDEEGEDLVENHDGWMIASSTLTNGVF